MESVVSERIKLLYAHFGNGNLSAFGRQIGVNAQTLRDLMKGDKGGPSWPVLQNMLQAFPTVRMEWLLTGEGDMLKNSAPEQKLEYPQKNTSYKGLPDPAGEGSIVDRLVRDPAAPPQPGQRPMLTYSSGGKKVGPPPTPAESCEPVGMDLIKQVAINTAAIAELRALLLGENYKPPKGPN